MIIRIFAVANNINMAKDELLKRLNDIEWEDFECKEALNKLPETFIINQLMRQ